jgi:hypothetical protein
MTHQILCMAGKLVWSPSHHLFTIFTWWHHFHLALWVRPQQCFATCTVRSDLHIVPTDLAKPPRGHLLWIHLLSMWLNVDVTMHCCLLWRILLLHHQEGHLPLLQPWLWLLSLPMSNWNGPGKYCKYLQGLCIISPSAATRNISVRSWWGDDWGDILPMSLLLRRCCALRARSSGRRQNRYPVRAK